MMQAHCGKAASCEQCPYPDCMWDGVDAAEYAESYERDADARHANMDKKAAQQRAYRAANREKYNAYHREYYRRKKEQRNERKNEAEHPGG